ncbi:hypothetical protein BJ138DRAFT_1142003 [Hygrophoropsis aurantiaca]|uniref:Uncharacterized protein n=1 Tax=Hygrophoropsis aurantiaca TaxID=72124 RepID=A0ACB8AQ41_9AGAM|nr:hypothetical protein BJ138DRAFT_1142003 [Hygrophoropsis aurantiaca]
MDALSDTRDSFRGDALGSVSIPQSHVPTSTPSPLPSTSVSSPRPSISVPSPRPSTSVPSPRPSTSAPSPRPSTSISSPRPSTSVSSSRPSMSNNHPQSSSNSTSTASHSRRHQPSGSLPRRPATADSTQESMRAQQRRAVKLANFFGVECEDISTATCLEVGSPLNAERATNTLAQVATVPLTQARVDVDVQVAKPTRFWKFMDGKNTLKNVHADDVMKELRTMKASM